MWIRYIAYILIALLCLLGYGVYLTAERSISRRIAGPPWDGTSKFRSGDPDSVNHLFEGRRVLPLCRAIKKRRLDEARRIVETGIDLNETGYHGITALTWAEICSYDASDYVELLLRHGASPDIPLTGPIEYGIIALRDGDTFLISASRYRWIKSFDLALSYSKHPGRTDLRGNTILHWSFAYEEPGRELRPDVWLLNRLNRIIDAGVDVNVKGGGGDTALHYAAMRSPQLVIPLIERGADPTIQNNNGMSAVDVIKGALSGEGKFRTSQELRPIYLEISAFLKERGYLSDETSQ